ncbi:hypothetical protein MJO29_013028 [Puccinia striiformis f. sp. tritici]|nr:hypothetical protein MJO29_013028 [Puccinia striiformis f. sp. tritici]
MSRHGQEVGAAHQQDLGSGLISPDVSLETYGQTLNYTIGSRELLSAGAHALKRFWGFIGGSFNLVRTDHESLKCFKTRRHVNQRRAPPQSLRSRQESAPVLRSEGFNLELGVDKAFTNLQQLKKSFPDELLEKGFKLINDDLFNTFNDLPDLPIITEL